MRTRKSLTLLLAALALTACKYDDSALWEQVNQNTERIAALEAWQAETNTNIQSLQTLLNTADYITAVTPITEEGVEVGYTITFLNSDPVTIYNGKDGEKGDTGATGAAGATPQIGVTQGEDGNWYWTLNGELLTDTDGNPIRANGEKGDKGDTGDTGAQGPQGEQGDTGDTGATGTSAPVPQLKTGASLTTQGVAQDAEGTDIVADAIYLSVDGGNTWYRVSGEKGEQGEQGIQGEDGDSFFQSVDTTSDPACVIFTLAGGTTFSVPRYTGIKVDFGDTTEVYLDYGTTETVNFTAEGSESFTTDNLFIIAPDGWKAEVTLPTRATGTAFSLTVTAPADAASGAAEGEILVMLDNGQGNTTIGRLTVGIKYTIDGTKLTARGLEAGELAKEINSRSDLTSITVTSGTLNETDWAAVVKNNAALLYLDLAGATYEGTDRDNLAYSYNGANDLPLLTVQLPQGVTGLGDHAFRDCTSLPSIDLPEGLESIGNRAFDNCKALTSITLPEGVTSIGEFAFGGCSVLTSIDLPETLTSIGYGAFHSCTSLTSIDLPEGLTTTGSEAFNNCTSLTSITLPETLTSIGDFAFSQCASLESITLPDKVTSIETFAFSGCSTLTTITLPDKVTSIGTFAFSDCSTLTTITCLATTPPTLGSMAFLGSDGLKTIYVPDGSEEAYKAASGWSEHSTKIKPISEKPQ